MRADDGEMPKKRVAELMGVSTNHVAAIERIALEKLRFVKTSLGGDDMKVSGGYTPRKDFKKLVPIPGWETAAYVVAVNGHAYAGFNNVEDAYEAVLAWRKSEWDGITADDWVEVLAR